MRALREAFARHAGGLPATFWWLWAGALVSAFGTFVFLFLAVYLTARGFDAREVGLVVAAEGLASLGAAPAAGWLADRWGRRPTLLASLAVSAAAALFLAAVTAPSAVVAGVLVFGWAGAMSFPAFGAIVADVVPRDAFERAFGVFYWANNLGVAFSAGVGGAIGARSWGGLFAADAATTLAFAAIVLLRLPETRPAAPAPDAASAPDAAPAGARGYATVLRDRTFVGFWLAFLSFLVVFWQFQVAAPIAMAREGLGPAEIGRVLMTNGIVIVLLQPFAARLVARRDPSRVLAGAAVLVGAGYAGYALCHRPAAFAAATALWSVGEVLTTPVAAAFVTRLAPPDLRGRYQGAFSLAWGTGRTVAPVLGGATLEAFGAQVLWPACFGVACLAAGAHLALGAARRRREAAALAA